MKTWSRTLGALTLGAVLVLAPKPARAGEETAEDRARVHFVAGVNLLQDPGKPRYEEAYAEFRRAHDLFPSYKILGNLAFTAMKLERDAEAIDAYTRYLAEAKDLAADERAQVERDLAVLKAGLATIAVESRPEGALLLDTRIPVQGEAITNAYAALRGKTPLGVRRGHHVLKARFPDGVELLWELDVAGGESHVFEKPESPAAKPASIAAPLKATAEAPNGSGERPIPTSVYIGGVTTVALAASAILTGVVALNDHSLFEQANDGSSPSRAASLRDDGRALNGVTDILTVGALIAAGITAYLYVTRPAVQPPHHGAAGNGASVGIGGLGGSGSSGSVRIAF